jgi:hypothetical protein
VVGPLAETIAQFNLAKQAGVGLFGSTAFAAADPTAAPGAISGLRERLAALRTELAELQKQNSGNDPYRFGPGVRDAIAQVNGQIDESTRKLNAWLAIERQAFGKDDPANYDSRDIRAHAKPTLDYTGAKDPKAGADKVTEFARAMQELTKEATKADAELDQLFQTERITDAWKAFMQYVGSPGWQPCPTRNARSSWTRRSTSMKRKSSPTASRRGRRKRRRGRRAAEAARGRREDVGDHHRQRRQAVGVVRRAGEVDQRADGASRQYHAELDKLSDAYDRGEISLEQYTTATDKLRASWSNLEAVKAAKKAADDSQRAFEEASQKIESVPRKRTVERVQKRRIGRAGIQKPAARHVPQPGAAADPAAGRGGHRGSVRESGGRGGRRRGRRRRRVQPVRHFEPEQHVQRRAKPRQRVRDERRRVGDRPVRHGRCGARRRCGGRGRVGCGRLGCGADGRRFRARGGDSRRRLGARHRGNRLLDFRAKGRRAEGRRVRLERQPSGLSNIGRGDNGRYFTPNNADTQLAGLVGGIQTRTASSLAALGGSGSASFALGYDTDPNGTAQSRVSAGAVVGGRTVYAARDVNAGRDDASLQAAITLESQRALLAALQASTLPKQIADILNSVTAGTATSDQITRVLALGGAYKQLGDMIARNPVDDALKAIATQSQGAYGAFMQQNTAMATLLTTYKGTTDQTTQLVSASQQFYSAAVQVVAQIQQIKTGLTGMFGDSIRSMTLSTLDNQGKYNYLTSDANSLSRQLRGAKDPQEIARLAGLISSDVSQAFSVGSAMNADRINKDPNNAGLTQDQRDALIRTANQALLASFTPYLAAVNSTAQTSLTNITTQITNSTTTTLTTFQTAIAGRRRTSTPRPATWSTRRTT